nr:hypothetical protein [Acholeplasmatales bacterium]
GNNHMIVYNLSDIVCYYKFNNIIILQTMDDNFLYLELDNVYNEKIMSIINNHNIKKNYLLRSYKKES